MKGKKEEKIINAAISVFSKKGFDLSNVDEIASKAGISKGTVFLYFKKKDDLIERVALLSVPYQEIVKINSQKYNNYKKLLADFGNAFLSKYEDEHMRNLFIMTMAKKGYYKTIESRLKELCFDEMSKMFSVAEKLYGKPIHATIRKAFFGALLCYIMWWGSNDIDPGKYVDDLIKNLLR
ncbi:MAG: TetR/AcrR family transcriptional regulator [Candidatus Marsarchaeota archaeon]|jgi:AcrR family transcriptional regulator|nr:TetR/AcrR family transcriptional regulator [Candidatus Marsarchaeota archaeon]MCL5419065.1 TetR/AcrR family transcriptional regulator [Candidatus Marsarchaeota archaeon]